MTLIPCLWRGRAAAALAGTALIALAAATPARALTNAEIAKYDKADWRAVIEEGARKEGTLTHYDPPGPGDDLQKRFRDKYPYIKLNVFRANGDDVVRRLIEEHKSGRNIADTINGNVGSLAVLADSGVLQSFTTPASKMYKPQGIGRGNFWMVEYLSYMGFAWNTKEALDAASVTTYEDLLDPKFKGKMAISESTGTTSRWVGVLALTKGEDYLRQLAKQEIRVFNVAPVALAGLIASGEVTMSPIVLNAHISDLKKKGASVAWKPLAGTVAANHSGLALASNAPHPYAAMLFLDFLLSDEGQKIHQDQGYATYRTDLTNVGQPEAAIDVAERPTYETDYEKWNDLRKQIFRPAQKN